MYTTALRWLDIIQPNASTVPARGRLVLTVEQARSVLAEVGQLAIPPALTWRTALTFARLRHEAELAHQGTLRAEWGPDLTFDGPAVRWDGRWTAGRWVQLRAHGEQVEMTWDSGTGRPSRFIAGLISAAGATYRAPVRKESPRALRERLGIGL